MSLLSRVLDAIKQFWRFVVAILMAVPDPIPVEDVPVEPTPVPEPEVPALVLKYEWDTPEKARHSVRVICDEEGLDVWEKNTMCATIGGESGYYTHAKNENLKTYPDGSLVLDTSGKPIVLSTDWGICQWNDYYHGDEISPDEAVHNPERAVRLMAKYWKMGETYRRWWIAYKSGRYKLFL